MGFVKKMLILFSAILALNIYLGPQTTLLYAKESKTKHPLEIRSTPEVDMKESEEQVKNNWVVLSLIGAALIGGIAALAGGGGGGGNGDDDDDPTGGSIVGSW